MKRALAVLVGIGVAGVAAYGYYNYARAAQPPTVNTAVVNRGDVVDTVGATGTLQAVTTVQVGSQVSGNIAYLGADFNSLVKKGQVLARLDPSLIEAQAQQSRANLAQAQANLVKAQSDLERNKVQLVDAQQKYQRTKELAAKELVAPSDLDAAKTTVDAAQAAVTSQQATGVQVQASVRQAEATVNQSQVNLDHTVIEAPIDGLVISRNVDVGQTVASSLQAPTLFVLAADLTKMQVVANLDESDVGRIRPGQITHFRVDAYPAEDFVGTVSQVRLQPIVQQNVVTYATVISVPNPELKLKPGMTANVTVEIARRTNVLRVPNAALRFRPSNEIFAALGQAAPVAEPGYDGPRQGRGLRAGTPSSAPSPAAGRGASAAPAAGADRPSRTAPTDSEGAAQAGDEGGRRGGGERLRDLSPEERARFAERFRGQGRGGAAQGASADAGQGATEGGRGGRRGAGQDGANRPDRAAAAPAGDQSAPQSLAAQNPKATTIDALFGPLAPVESTGRVWLNVDKQLKPVRVRLGITDGQATELIEGDLKAGDELVTSVITAGEATRPAATQGFPPFLNQQQRGGFPGGNFGGGGGARGGGGGGGRGR